MSSELQQYQSHKIVHARPMTRGAYNSYRGWVMPENEDASEEGYLTVYQRDTPDHYESWCPKPQFDEGNQRVPDTWQGRVEQEFEDLDANLLKLLGFIGSEEYKSLDIITQRLLQLQQSAMLQYGGSLQDRLDYDKTLLEDIAQAQANIDELRDHLCPSEGEDGTDF